MRLTSMFAAPAAVAALALLAVMGACETGSGDGGPTGPDALSRSDDDSAEVTGDATAADAAGTPDPGLTVDSLEALDAPSDPGPLGDADAEPDDAPLADALPGDVPVEEDGGAGDVLPADSGPEPWSVPAQDLVWGKCDKTSWPDGYPAPPFGLQCATIQVPRDYEELDGPTRGLLLARQPAQHPTGRAVFFLAGGPGGAASHQSSIIAMLVPELLKGFDLVYLDQRGTGGSERLDCPGGYPETKAAWIACAEALAPEPLEENLTLAAAHDVEWTRQVLGYGPIYVRGGSYGTRVGLELLRQHPDSLAAMVLDGLAPPDVDFFADVTRNPDHGVGLLVADCEADPDCLAVSPTLGSDLLGRLAALADEPHRILIGGQGYAEDAATFAYLLTAFLYTAEWRYQVPRAIHAAVGGDNTLWNGLIAQVAGASVTDAPATTFDPLPPPPLAAMRRRLPLQQPLLGGDPVAPGLHMLILCTEWLPNSGGVAALAEVAAEQSWGDDAMVQRAEACASLPVAPLSAELRAPVVSDRPVLLMSGAIDLNTVLAWADRAFETLPAASHLVVPYATHSTLLVPCAAQIMVAYFQAKGDMAAVDTSCLEAIPKPAW